MEFFARHGIGIHALLTDNGASYRSRQFRHACQQMAIQHSRIRPYTPRTNGKADYCNLERSLWIASTTCCPSALRAWYNLLIFYTHPLCSAYGYMAFERDAGATRHFEGQAVVALVGVNFHFVAV